MNPVFFGRVLDGGLLVLDQPKVYAQHLRTMRGKHVEITARVRRQKRSNPQNAWLWGCALELLVESFGYDTHERKAVKETLHYELVNRCFGTRYDERLKIDVPNVRSSQLSPKEFGEYMEWLVRYAVEHYDGIVIPLPDDVEDTGALWRGAKPQKVAAA